MKETARKQFCFPLREELLTQLKTYCSTKGLKIYRLMEDVIAAFLAAKQVEGNKR